MRISYNNVKIHKKIVVYTCTALFHNTATQKQMHHPNIRDTFEWSFYIQRLFTWYIHIYFYALFEFCVRHLININFSSGIFVAEQRKTFDMNRVNNLQLIKWSMQVSHPQSFLQQKCYRDILFVNLHLKERYRNPTFCSKLLSTKVKETLPMQTRSMLSIPMHQMYFPDVEH